MSVEYIEWNRNGLCGAACAHMVLHARNLTGTKQADQEDIWTSIKDHTAGQSTLQCTGIVPEEFQNMIRESCSGLTVKCWETYPNALTATLKALLGEGVAVALRKTISEAKANSRIKSCLKRGGLPIVLIDNGAHWVLVDGWNENDPLPVSLLDPAVGQPSTVDLDTWNIDRMSSVDCGKFHHKYVVVEVG